MFGIQGFWNLGVKFSWNFMFESKENISGIEVMGLDEIVQRKMQNEKRVKEGV